VENASFPPFNLPVLSRVEAIFKGLQPENEMESSLPLAASLLAFLAHSERGGGGGGGGEYDLILCDLLRSTNPADLLDWRLGPLLSGKLWISKITFV
jgi:hypothetical protein